MSEDNPIYETEYDKQDHINEKTWTRKRVYDTTPYLVIPAKRIVLKVGDTGKNLCFFIKQLGDQFGDPMGLIDIESFTINICTYNSSGHIVFKGLVNIVNPQSGEVKYTFSKFDFDKPGVYYFEIDMKSEGSSYTITGNEIIVK